MLCRSGFRHLGQKVIRPAQALEGALTVPDPEWPRANSNLKQTARRMQS
jgi:hypothetical protein